jgi:hypothetical protein
MPVSRRDWIGGTSQSESAATRVSCELADGLLEVGEGWFERGEGVDVDHAVDDRELVEVDELQGGGCRLGGDRRVGEHVDTEVAVLGRIGTTRANWVSGLSSVLFGVGEVGGGLLQGLLRVGDLAVLDELEPVEQPEVAVACGPCGPAPPLPTPRRRSARMP